MGRSKRAIDLAVRVLFIVLCFIFTYLFNAAMGFVNGNADYLTQEGRIELKLSGDAQATYTVQDGQLILDVQKAGTNYDDITVIMTVDGVSYDTTYAQEGLGDKAADYEQELNALAAGPWSGTMHYVLSGEDYITTGDGQYTFVDADQTEYAHKPASAEANARKTTEEMNFSKGGTAVAKFILGSAENGPLPEGKYTMSAHITMTGTQDGTKLPFGAQLTLAVEVMKDSLASTSFGDFFRISSLMTFYGVMCALCCVLFGYQDLAVCFDVFWMIIKGAGGGPVTRYVVHTYVNGVHMSTREYLDDNSSGSLPVAILAFVLVYFFLILTVPLRLLIVIGKDIYHIIAGDPDEEGFPLLGNILGSIGVYALLYGVVNAVLSQFVVAGICLVPAVALLIVAGKLCK